MLSNIGVNLSNSITLPLYRIVRWFWRSVHTIRGRPGAAIARTVARCCNERSVPKVDSCFSLNQGACFSRIWEMMDVLPLQEAWAEDKNSSRKLYSNLAINGVTRVGSSKPPSALSIHKARRQIVGSLSELWLLRSHVLVHRRKRREERKFAVDNGVLVVDSNSVCRLSMLFLILSGSGRTYSVLLRHRIKNAASRTITWPYSWKVVSCWCFLKG